MDKVRKTVDLPKEVIMQLGVLALKKDLTLKAVLERLIINAATKLEAGEKLA